MSARGRLQARGPLHLPRRLRRLRRRCRHGLVLGLLLTLLSVTTACDFDGAYDLPLPGSVDVGDKPVLVTAEFGDVLGVVPKSEVRVDDVPVGEVTDVSRRGWHAEVTMALQREVRLPDNAVAEVRQTSLLGEKFIALTVPPGGSSQGRLSDGDHLPLDRTGRSPEVEEVLGALSLLLHGGGVAQLQTISHELNALMSGRQQRIGDFFHRLDTLLGTLDSQREQIVRAMRSMDRLTRTLNAERDTVTAALDTTGPALRVLANQRRQLVRMLDGLSKLGRVGTRVVNETSADTLAQLRHLDPILTKLAEAGRSLPNGLEILLSFPFPREAQDVILGDYANTAAYFDVDLAQLVKSYTRNSGLPKLPHVSKLPKLPDVKPPRGGLPGGGLPDVQPPKLPERPRLRDLRRLCEQAGQADGRLPRRLRTACRGDAGELSARRLRSSIRALCAETPRSPLTVRVCPAPADRRRPGHGDPLDGLPGGAVGDGGGLLSGGLG